jgi:hypothetical protein
VLFSDHDNSDGREDPLDLRVGEGALDLKLRRRDREVEVDVARREGELDVVVAK